MTAAKTPNSKTPDKTPKRAKLFMSGRSQAVRLPKEFRLPGREVKITRVGQGVLLEPVEFDLTAIFAAIDAIEGPPFPEEIDEPPMPPDDPEEMFD